MVRVLALVLALVVAIGAIEALSVDTATGIQSRRSFDWDYKQQGENWTGMCKKGEAQSPVDLSPKRIIQARMKNKGIEFRYSSNVQRRRRGLRVLNNGRTLQAQGRFGHIRLFEKEHWRRYKVSHFQFHSPSEHTVDGQHYDMEMQIVHRRKGCVGSQCVAVVSLLLDGGVDSQPTKPDPCKPNPCKDEKKPVCKPEPKTCIKAPCPQYKCIAKVQDDKKAEDKKTDDKKAEDKKTDDKKTEDKKTDDKKAEDKKTDDKKTEDKKTDDKKTEDKKTDDKKTDDKKSEDKKTDDKKTEEKKGEATKTETKTTDKTATKEADAKATVSKVVTQLKKTIEQAKTTEVKKEEEANKKTDKKADACDPNPCKDAKKPVCKAEAKTCVSTPCPQYKCVAKEATTTNDKNTTKDKNATKEDSSSSKADPKCQAPFVFHSCGSMCPPTCANLKPICAKACKSGCFCPKGKLLHEGKCITSSECPSDSKSDAGTPNQSDEKGHKLTAAEEKKLLGLHLHKKFNDHFKDLSKILDAFEAEQDSLDWPNFLQVESHEEGDDLEDNDLDVDMALDGEFTKTKTPVAPKKTDTKSTTTKTDSKANTKTETKDGSKDDSKPEAKKPVGPPPKVSDALRAFFDAYEWKHEPKQAGNARPLRRAGSLTAFRSALNGAFYRYTGSMTTPPCREKVRWFVAQKVIKVPRSVVLEFRKRFNGNNRKVQRTVTALLA